MIVQLSFAVVCAVACALPSSAPAKVGTCLLLLGTAVNVNDPSVTTTSCRARCEV